MPMATKAPVGLLAPLNGDVSFTFHTRHGTLKSITPLESLVPLASMVSIKQMKGHLHQWIANVANGAIEANHVIDAIGFQWRLWKTHRQAMATMEPFKLRH